MSFSRYDIISLEKISGKEDEAGMHESRTLINGLIESEMDLGIPNTRIILGGFSQGAAMTLLTGLSSPIKLGGLVALSGYLPLLPKFTEYSSHANKQTPLFMGHGDADQVVRYNYGFDSSQYLKKAGYPVQFETYRGMGHSSCDQEFQDLVKFLQSRL